MKVIKDLRVLKAIVKKSKYKLTIDKRYKHLSSGDIITPIRYKGKKYISKYIDGCFYPYIVELI